MRLIRDDKTGFKGERAPVSVATRSPIRETARRKSWRTIAALVVVMVMTLVLQAAAGPRIAVVLEIDGAIGPAIADYVSRELTAVRPSDTGLVILRIDTPGGLDTSMREIIRTILASPVPVGAYVAPSGARAASAGTYITYACAIAAMAPGTTGAATPVQLQGLPLLPGGQPQPPAKGNEGNETAGTRKAGSAPNAEPEDTETRKVLNDFIAYIRSLAELNGRNADWATEAVVAPRASRLPTRSSSTSSTWSLRPDLLRQADGRTVMVAGKPEVLATAGLQAIVVAPDWRTASRRHHQSQHRLSVDAARSLWADLRAD